MRCHIQLDWWSDCECLRDISAEIVRKCEERQGVRPVPLKPRRKKGEFPKEADLSLE